VIRRTAPIEIVSPDLPGLVIRARPLTIPEACKVHLYRSATPLMPDGVADVASLLDSIGFTVEDEGKPYAATDFLVTADIQTVQRVFAALLLGNADGAAVEKQAKPPPRPEVSPE
jgi:hypothetical protein